MNEIESNNRDFNINVSWKDSPVPHNYYGLRRLRGLMFFSKNRWKETAYNLSEALATTARLSALYRSQKSQQSQDSFNAKLLANYAGLQDAFKNLNLPTTECDDFFRDVKKTCDNFAKSNSDAIFNASNVQKLQHLDPELLTFEKDANLRKFDEKLQGLPKEWTIIQLTSNYDPSEQWETQEKIKTNVNSFFITLLKCESMNDPITVMRSSYDLKLGEVPLFTDLHNTLQENLNVIENNLRLTSNSVKQYWERRGDCDLRLKGVIRTMNLNWLHGWRCLLSGNILDSKINTFISNKIEELSEKHELFKEEAVKTILFKMAGMIHQISSREVSLVVWDIYKTYSKRSDDVCSTCEELKLFSGICGTCEPEKVESHDDFIKVNDFIETLMKELKKAKELKDLSTVKRGPVILLVDEKLDMFPWESLPSLKDQLVTRMESLHFTYALYKSLEDQFVDGYFQLKPEKGTYLINPGGDLMKMEKRMGSFIDYWCPQWEGQRNSQPSDDLFQKYLQKSDFFLYCGHNDGAKYIGGGTDRLAEVKAVTTLSGCGSVRLRSPGMRLLPLPVHSQYHNAKCPCVVGMLWEVTDLEVDKVTSMFLGLFLPSKASNHWGDVNKSQWNNGVIETTNSNGNNFKCEPNMLKALAMARKSSSYAMIAASVVARGLPISIHPDYQAN